MCGRFANHLTDMGNWHSLLEDWPAGCQTGFNVAPGQVIPVLTGDGLRPMAWSLVPRWAKSSELKYATFNARVETAAEKPAFRGAWKAAQRCLIPVLGYYEWRAQEGLKQPYFVHQRGGEPLMLAGLWDYWHGDAEEVYSCTILTRQAHPAIDWLHDRMPCVIDHEQSHAWLYDPHSMAPDGVPDAEALEVYAVERAVNNVRNQGAELIKPRQ